MTIPSSAIPCPGSRTEARAVAVLDAIGMTAQWVAWRFRPAIILLLTAALGLRADRNRR